MAEDLAYDMMLEVRGLIRSYAVRTRLDRDLRAGEMFSLRGRQWVVSNVRPANSEGLDRRLIAHELDEPDSSLVAN